MEGGAWASMPWNLWWPSCPSRNRARPSTASTTGCARPCAGWRGCAARSSSGMTAPIGAFGPPGRHNMDTDHFAGAYVTVDTLSIAARALREDRVVEVEGDLTGQVPDEFA